MLRKATNLMIDCSVLGKLDEHCEEAHLSNFGANAFANLVNVTEKNGYKFLLNFD